jgi:replicative DNA helicase
MPNNYKIDNFVKRLDKEDRSALIDKMLEPGVWAEHNKLKEEATALTMLGEWIEPAQELVENRGKIIGLQTGYESIDDLTKGLKAGDLIVLAGQASHGKTLVANNITYRIAKRNEPVLFVTLEMTKAKITSRFMMIAEDDNHDPADLPIYYQQTDWLSAPDLERIIKKAVAEGVKTVVIDHLHFLADRAARDMRGEIGSITKKMKQCAVELEIPIILLAQVKRLEDPTRKPQNNDLKETGYIEQDADIILMVWRDISIDSPDPNAVEVYCTKNRDSGFTNERVKHFYQSGATLLENLPVIPLNNPFDS